MMKLHSSRQSRVANVANIKIINGEFDPFAILSQQSASLDMSKIGACNSFVGSMRDFNQGDSVLTMELEYYPGMTEKALEKLANHAIEKWNINDVLIVHRVGPIKPSDVIVLVAAWSAHRADAFSACRFLIDELKTKAPFWKKEQLKNSSRWVEKNT